MGQVMTGQAMTVQVMTGQVMTGQVMTSQVRTGLVRAVKSGQDSHDRSSQDHHFFRPKMQLRMEFDSGVGPTCK